MQQIAHIVHRDKFTVGYIELMQMTFPQYAHVFFVAEKGERLNVPGESAVYYASVRDILMPFGKYHSVIRSSSKIIVTGVFSNSVIECLCFAPRLLKKTYFHFWGGDFYKYRDMPAANVRKKMSKSLRQKCFSRCAGLVFLIDGEYEKFKEIMGVENRNFTAPMLSSPNQVIDYSKYRSEYDDSVLRILVGNSATKENRHEEAFRILKEHLTGDYSVICPLSYGVKEYGDSMEKLGRELFEDKFVPLREFMPKEDYVQLLANCDIGFFNNDRQQAMGNINILLRLGKTVYMRDNTSMWDSFREEGYFLRSIEEIGKNGLTLITEEESGSNRDPERIKQHRTLGISRWQRVLED